MLLLPEQFSTDHAHSPYLSLHGCNPGYPAFIWCAESLPQQAAQRNPALSSIIPPGTPGTPVPGLPRAFSTTSMASVVVNEAEPEPGHPDKPFGGKLRSLQVSLLRAMHSGDWSTITQPRACWAVHGALQCLYKPLMHLLYT